MPRLPLVPLLVAAAAALSIPAEASAACGGATRFQKAEICPPTAQFSAGATEVLPGATVDFDAAGSSVMSPRTLVEFAWDFDGDGADDVVRSDGTRTASWTYGPAARSYEVRLRVTDSDGLVGVKTLTVNVGNPPTAVLVASDDSPLTLTPITLDASGSADALDGGTIENVAFDLDEHPDFETDPVGGDATTTVSFPTPGPRTVRVQVTDTDGRTAIASRQIDVRNQAPTAGLALPSVALAGRPATLSAVPSNDVDGSIVSYRWDLDGLPGHEVDGGTLATIDRAWPASGSFPVGVEVTDDSGATATATGVLVVKTAPSAALAATPLSPLPGEAVALSAAGSSDADGAIDLYEWDLDGDGVFELSSGTTPTATVTFAAPGNVTVRVRVTDADRLTATASAAIAVGPAGGSGTPSTGEPSPGDATTPGTGPGTTGGGSAPGGSTTATAAGTPDAGAAAGPTAETTGAPRAGNGVLAIPASIDAKSIQSLRTILRSGLRLACRAPVATRCTLRVELDTATARRLRLGTTTPIGTASLRGRATGATRVALSARARRALARTRAVRFVVRVVATAADGSTTAVSRVVLARR